VLELNGIVVGVCETAVVDSVTGKAVDLGSFFSTTGVETWETGGELVSVKTASPAHAVRVIIRANNVDMIRFILIPSWRDCAIIMLMLPSINSTR